MGMEERGKAGEGTGEDGREGGEERGQDHRVYL